jgi:predicted HTH domain antitoxin
MSTLTVSLDLPRDLLGALDVPEARLETRLRELIAVELFREGRISSGKGAELLGVSKGDFIHLLARRGVSYFTESPEELVAEVMALEQLLSESSV